MSQSVDTDGLSLQNLTNSSDFRRFKQRSESEWKQLRSDHEHRIDSLLSDYLERRSQHERNPVLDFLFEYYSFRPSLLRRWTPGMGVLLKGNNSAENALHDAFVTCDAGAFVDPKNFPAHRKNSIRWILNLLRAISSRSPRFGCYGLHEWAMVYQTEKVRHPYLPLRLPLDEIAGFVDTQQIACSHFDAFRFFTKPARPLNNLQPHRENRMELEQPGCVHVTMDLYKWAYKIYPWIDSDLLTNAFELAIDARTVDMQASPYDMREYGLQPIKIETTDGRIKYRNEQEKLALKAGPIRERIIKVYEDLLGNLKPQDTK